MEGGREGKGKRHFLSIKKQKNIWIFNQALKIVSKENEQKQKNIYKKIFLSYQFEWILTLLKNGVGGRKKSLETNLLKNQI